MYRLGLSRSIRNRDVLEAGESLFGKDNWQVDRVFYRLGKDGFETRKQIENYYRSQVLGKRDQDILRSWRRHEQDWSTIVRKAKTLVREHVQGDGWTVREERQSEAIGFYFYLLRRHGGLSAEFANGDLYLWTGIWLDVRAPRSTWGVDLSSTSTGELHAHLVFETAC